MGIKEIIKKSGVSDRIGFLESRKVLVFYYRLMVRDFAFSLLIILTGLIGRVLNLVVFMLIVKVFLSVVNPQSSVEMVNRILLRVTDYQLESLAMLQLMLVILTVLIFVQYFISEFNLKLFLARRTILVNYALASSLNDHQSTHLHLCLDHLPPGYDAILKCCEIILFYMILFVAIFFVSPFAALLTITIVPMLIVLLVIKNRKEVHSINEFRVNRASAKTMDDDVSAVIKSSNQQFSHLRKSVVHSEFFGGIALVFLMFIFLFNYDGGNINSLGALALVFAVRFSITYAGELSRHAGRILQQRVIINKVTNADFM